MGPLIVKGCIYHIGLQQAITDPATSTLHTTHHENLTTEL
jgi:hypothetical protein